MKRKSIIFSFGIIWSAQICLAYEYIHESSRVEFQLPPETRTSSAYFGYSLAYQPTRSRLVVGAPRYDLYGKVFSCPITNDKTNDKQVVCKDIGIDVNKLANDYTREKSPEQKFQLGASISIIDDYVFTCAPLWTKEFIMTENDKLYVPVGSCFWNNGTYSERYSGLAEQYIKQNGTKEKAEVYKLYGGVGWNTLADPQNNIVITVLSQTDSTMSFVRMNQPSDPAALFYSSFKNNFPWLSSYSYLGHSMAVGNFFSKDSRVFAFSMISKKKQGAIGFFQYQTDSETMEIRQEIIKNYETNSMFGNSLHFADVNKDDFDDLIVGAPAYTKLKGYEHGAVFFYLGGQKRFKKPNLVIEGTNNAARFGSAISSIDLDNDAFPEIVISAPFENKGAVYILSGHEIKTYYLKSNGEAVKLSSFKIYKRIFNTETQAFGFSIQPIVDSDGINALAIGSPTNDKVLLYRSMPSIKVLVSGSLQEELVREQDKSFTMNVNIHVTYPLKPDLITGELLLEVEVKGNAAHFKDDKGVAIMKKYSNLNLDKLKDQYIEKVIVYLDDEKPGYYHFRATVKEDPKALERKVFDSSLYAIREYDSVLEYTRTVARQCKDNVCEPNLTVNIMWSGSNDTYLLGSTTTEAMMLTVTNAGHATYTSCAKIKITVPGFTIPGCEQTEDSWYKCDMLQIERGEFFPIIIDFRMDQLTNQDENLIAYVTLYNDCDSVKPNLVAEKNIKLISSAGKIFINSSDHEWPLPKSEIKNNSHIPYIFVRKSFMAINDDSFTWKSISAEIIIYKEPFIEDVDILSTAFVCENNKSDNATLIILKCTIDVPAKSTSRIQTSIKVIRENIMDHFKEDKLKINTNFNLHLSPTSVILSENYTTTIFLKEDIGFGNNKNVIIAISCLVAFIVVGITTVILHKCGFFKSKNKDKLDELKKSIRRPSNARPSHPVEQAEEEIELEVIENAIQLPGESMGDYKDSEILIKN